ncbi:hypothetical protein N7456_007229 [Penicillium angulare]|uniref:Extracellular membrane protein CFEM domain-containing protein n=1 Tax=Penicillium angulare TaxID=116970 RepID=A0A9W9KDM8_9EURO|nr:hypothetical protein N7456_007229 [Penicillium angulare]
MKLLLSVVLFAASGVLAQSSDCTAQYIVDRCLETEKPIAEACGTTDNVCLCAAYEAISA